MFVAPVIQKDRQAIGETMDLAGSEEHTCHQTKTLLNPQF